MNKELQQWKRSQGQFPVKLYTMLELTSSDARELHHSSDLVAWLPHGRAFKVLDEQKFVKYMIPYFFKQTKIRSFYRQLGLWGFKRLSMGPDMGAWYNRFFLRDFPNEMPKLIRVKIKGKSNSEKSLKYQSESEFYNIVALPHTSKSDVKLLHGDCLEACLSSVESSTVIRHDIKEYNIPDEIHVVTLPDARRVLSTDAAISTVTPSQSPLWGGRCIIDASNPHQSVHPSTLHLNKQAFNLFHQKPQMIPSRELDYHATHGTAYGTFSIHDGSEVKKKHDVLEPLPFNEEVPYDDLVQYRQCYGVIVDMIKN